MNNGKTDLEEQLYGANDLSYETIVSARGGAGQTTFFVSGLLKRDAGILKGTGYTKSSLRANLTQGLSSRAHARRHDQPRARADAARAQQQRQQRHQLLHGPAVHAELRRPRAGERRLSRQPVRAQQSVRDARQAHQRGERLPVHRLGEHAVVGDRERAPEPHVHRDGWRRSVQSEERHQLAPRAPVRAPGRPAGHARPRQREQRELELRADRRSSVLPIVRRVLDDDVGRRSTESPQPDHQYHHRPRCPVRSGQRGPRLQRHAERGPEAHQRLRGFRPGGDSRARREAAVHLRRARRAEQQQRRRREVLSLPEGVGVVSLRGAEQPVQRSQAPRGVGAIGQSARVRHEVHELPLWRVRRTQRAADESRCRRPGHSARAPDGARRRLRCDDVGWPVVARVHGLSEDDR